MPEVAKNDQPFVSGQVLSSFVEYVKKKRGAEGYNRMKAEIDFDIAGISNERDYPVGHSHKIMDYLVKTYGDQEIFMMGRFCLGNIGAKRYFALLLPPEKLLERLMESLNKVSNTTKMDYALTENGAEVTMKLDDMTAHLSDFWRGMLQGIFDLTKTNGKVEYLGPGKTKGTWLFRMSWK